MLATQGSKWGRKVRGASWSYMWGPITPSPNSISLEDGLGAWDPMSYYGCPPERPIKRCQQLQHATQVVFRIPEFLVTLRPGSTVVCC
mmetsp:Transcript_52821/g.94298  ORF Transcript_52821/g.94298 Transcript_52821/m.94298 type:complete len:88 (+) Transcript_52821:167-430(+)